MSLKLVFLILLSLFKCYYTSCQFCQACVFCTQPCMCNNCGECSYVGGPGGIGLIALVGILVDLQFSTYDSEGGYDGIDYSCDTYFGWNHVENDVLTLNIAINEDNLLLTKDNVTPKYRDTLVNNKNNVKSIIVNSINYWATEPETLCNKNIDLQLNVKNSARIDNNGIGLCAAKGDNTHCPRPVSNDIQIYIAGFVDFNVVDNYFGGSAKYVSGYAVLYDENNNLLQLTNEDKQNLLDLQGFKTNKIFKEINYVEIYLNKNFKWGNFTHGDKLNKGQLDIKSVILHELGHAFIYKLHSNNILTAFINSPKLPVDDSIANPNVGKFAKQELTSLDVNKFCREFGAYKEAAHIRSDKLIKDSLKNNDKVAENNDNNLGNNLGTNNLGNNNYILFFGVCIILLLAVNILVQCYNNIKKESTKGKYNYAKVDGVSTESETDIQT